MGIPPYLDPQQYLIFVAMQKLILLTSALFFTVPTWGQRTLERVIEKWVSEDVPLATVKEVTENPSYLLLDAREREEYQVSHLPDSHYIGYREFDEGEFTRAFPDKNATYVVYCSVGVRSGKIGERLQELGYTDVRNLRGGIFKWMEEGQPLLDPEGKTTLRIHAYNRYWGMLLNSGEKVYGPVNEESDEG
jgi:rhodanese-related sulfurtransferase